MSICLFVLNRRRASLPSSASMTLNLSWNISLKMVLSSLWSSTISMVSVFLWCRGSTVLKTFNTLSISFWTVISLSVPIKICLGPIFWINCSLNFIHMPIPFLVLRKYSTSLTCILSTAFLKAFNTFSLYLSSTFNNGASFVSTLSLSPNIL